MAAGVRYQLVTMAVGHAALSSQLTGRHGILGHGKARFKPWTFALDSGQGGIGPISFDCARLGTYGSMEANRAEAGGWV
jgi:hypothetical protein